MKHLTFERSARVYEFSCGDQTSISGDTVLAPGASGEQLVEEIPMSISEMIPLLLLIVLFVIPAAAVWAENTEKRVKRKVFGIWIVAILAFSYLLGPAMAFLFGRAPDAILISGVAFALSGSIIIQILFIRVLVRRVRDAGHRKSLAYLSLLPLANVGLILYLAFKDSAPIHSDVG